MIVSFRRIAFVSLAPVVAFLGVGACATKIGGHPPEFDSGPNYGDAFLIDHIDHFPEVDTGGRESAKEAEISVDSSIEANDAETSAEVADETSDEAIVDTADEADAGDGFDATPVVDECGPPLSTSSADAGSCTATIQSWADEGHTHETPGTIIDYCTNPPNSGPHYYIWASYRSYDHPIPHGYLVHDLEHGAVDVYYKCADESACPTIAAQLQSIIDARPVDPLCDTEAGISRRVILSPDPGIPTLVAAAAWGWTYTADCVDPTTLGAFIDAHYAMAAEDFCSDGIVPP